jgi:hypothetical protein
VYPVDDEIESAAEDLVDSAIESAAEDLVDSAIESVIGSQNAV